MKKNKNKNKSCEKKKLENEKGGGVGGRLCGQNKGGFFLFGVDIGSGRGLL